MKCELAYYGYLHFTPAACPSNSCMIHERLASIKTELSALRLPPHQPPPLLIAVSKTKPASEILTAYSEPSSQRHFGENYVQELVDKACTLRQQCPQIRWHFIGSLQSNKIKGLVEGVGPALASIQTIDSVGKLERVVQVIEKLEQAYPAPVELYLQVNISNEASKHGFTSVEDLKEAFSRFRALQAQKCRLVGLMCIGEPGESTRDFTRMNELKQELSIDGLKLSMGMSADYLEASRMGSDCIRVGSLIFGEREVVAK